MTKKNIKKLITTALMICLFAGLFCINVTVPAYAEPAVKLGQANCGEGGKLRGCRAGDQTGKEVAISGWTYSGSSSSSFHWVYVFRAKDPEVGRKMADAMKEAAANSHVGYDQNVPDRYSLYDEAKKVGWDISAISNNCETTCASVVSVCCNVAGISTPKMLYSGIVYRELMATGAFDCYTSGSYTASSANLLPGDILCNPKRHTAMVVESPNPFVYEVNYSDDSGKDQTDYAEEGSTINLNLNNGEKAVTLTADGKIDLEQYEPEKEFYKFNGWKKVGTNAYSAKFESSMAPIQMAGSAATALKPLKDSSD
jgi:hypothetical protein